MINHHLTTSKQRNVSIELLFECFHNNNASHQVGKLNSPFILSILANNEIHCPIIKSAHPIQNNKLTYAPSFVGWFELRGNKINNKKIIIDIFTAARTTWTSNIPT